VIISWAGATNTHGHKHDLDLEQRRGLLPSSGARDRNQISSKARVASDFGTFFVLFFLINRTKSVLHPRNSTLTPKEIVTRKRAT
jgi:hypothetical protein